MRAREFVNEGKVGPLSKRNAFATVGLHKFRDNQFADRVYELNRVMMAVAQADGKNDFEIDAESWSGRNNVAAPYTQEEHEMLKQAFKKLGTYSMDLNHGDLDSEEVDSINPVSPIKAFKGYAR